jgi:hypothetical protein
MEYTFVIDAIPPTPEEFELLWESNKKNFLEHDTYRIPTIAGLDNEFQINQTDADKKDWIFTSLRSLDMFQKIYKNGEIAGLTCFTYRTGLENFECLNELIPNYGETSVVCEFGLYRDMGKADGWGWPEDPSSINPLWKKGKGIYPQPYLGEE